MIYLIGFYSAVTVAAAIQEIVFFLKTNPFEHNIYNLSGLMP